VGVGGLGAGVGQAVLHGVEDLLLELLDRLGELGERRETTPLGPGQPAGQQALGGGEVAGLEDRPQLLVR
jgi:hypothetical protein